MFELPSMWNLVLSTLAFFGAAWYIRRWLEAHDIPPGMTRGMLVFILASLVSWTASSLEEKLHGTPEPAHQAAQASFSLHR